MNYKNFDKKSISSIIALEKTAYSVKKPSIAPYSLLRNPPLNVLIRNQILHFNYFPEKIRGFLSALLKRRVVDRNLSWLNVFYRLVI